MTKTMGAVLIEMITTPEEDGLITKRRREWMLDEHMRLRRVERYAFDLYAKKDRRHTIKAMGLLSNELYQLHKFRERRGLGRYGTNPPK